jgi:hypothetical protein
MMLKELMAIAGFISN